MKNELIEKSIKVRQLFSEVDFPPTMIQFFDLDSDELLDEKIRVLTALKMESRLQIFQTFMIFWNYTPKTGNIGTKKHGQIAVLFSYLNKLSIDL